MSFLFYLLPFVFFLQTRIPIANIFHGNDYEIVFVYVRDIVVSSFILVGLWKHYREIVHWMFSLKVPVLWMGILGLFSFSSVFASIDRTVALYRTTLLFLYMLFAMVFGWYVMKKKDDWVWVKWWIPSILVIGLLAVAEIITGNSANLWFLGNWDYSILTPGIARVSLFGESLLRPYTVFPHPNVLGGVALVLLLLFSTQIKKDETTSRFYFVGIFVAWLLIVISFSRSAWIASLLALILLLWKLKPGLKLVKYIIAACLVSSFIAVPYLLQVSANDPSVSERKELFHLGTQIIEKSPVLGVGAGNFTIALSRYRSAERNLFLQPVHVVIVLVAAELGVIASVVYVLGLFWMGYSLFNSKNDRKAVILLSIWFAIGSIGLVDHYWWSLPVGISVFWLIVGLSLAVLQSKPRI